MWIFIVTIVMWVVGLGSCVENNMVVFQGMTIPELCLWQRWFDWTCFGCGLTRSVVCASHFDVVSSLGYHPFGALLLYGYTVHCVFRLYRMKR